MKHNTIRSCVVLAIYLGLLVTLLQLPSVLGLWPWTETHGGKWEGIQVRELFKIHQEKIPLATDLHFVLWQKEPWIHINGWLAVISHFTDSTSAITTPDNHSVTVNAFFDQAGYVEYCTWVYVNASLWLTDQNTLRIEDINWTWNGQNLKAAPNHGWTVDDPVTDSQNPGSYFHTITITNDDPTGTFTITEFAFLVTMTWYPYLETIVFPAPLPDFTLGPEQSWTYNIPSVGLKAHVYFKYDIIWNGDKVLTAIADHPVPSGVGGVWIAVDKFGLLAPYVGLASTTAIGAVATVVYVRRAKRKEEKQ